MLYIIGGVILLALLVMLLKKVFRLRAEDQNLSDKDDYLERRVKKDDEDK